jgi:tripartite-type tricarboxylate transporter receptor subunit TctC
MGSIGRALSFAFAVFLAQTVLSAPARAQFYAGKSITMLVNFGAGGNADISARVFQQYLEKHIPGAPTIVVQNMPGASGYVAMNLLGRGVGFRPDGLSAGFFGVSPAGLIGHDPGLQVTMRDFAIIGAVRDWDIAYIRKDAVAGYSRPEDIVKAKEIYAGGYGRSDVNDARSSLSLKVLGVPFKMITGFQGTSDLNKAMLQNEINFVNSAMPAYLKQAVPQIIRPGVGAPLFYFPSTGANGAPSRQPYLESLGISSFQDVYHRIFGKAPSGANFDALLLMSDLDSNMHGLIVMPKDTPAAAVQAMRQGFAALSSDAQFAADYQRITGEPPILVGNKQLQPLIARIDVVSPAVRDIFKQMIAQQ